MLLTAEQHLAVEAAQGKPVDVVDPQTQRTYVLLSAELYQHVRDLVATREQGELRRAPNAIPNAAALAAEGQAMRVKLRELPIPPPLAEEINKHCRRLGFWRRKYVQQVEEELKCQYYFGGQYVAYLPSEQGPIVVAAGTLESEAFDRQLAFLAADERQQVILDAVDPWNDPTSLILSPSSTHED